MTISATQPVKIHSARGFRARAIGALGRIVHHWQHTLAYTGLEQLQQAYHEESEGSVILLWHNRLFPVIGAFGRIEKDGRQLYALVSASRDGGQVSHFLHAQGIRTIRGSSSRRGGVAARELVRIVRRGHHIAITVDGPRGPCYRAQSGGAFLADLTGSPLCLVGAECESCHTLASWDRFMVPMPFSRVRMKLDRFRLPGSSGKPADRDGIRQRIEDRLRHLTGDGHLRA